MKFEFEIDKEKGFLKGHIHYSVITTKEDVDIAKGYFQWRFSEKSGEKVSKDEIRVNVKEGEESKRETVFCIKENNPLPLCFKLLDPFVLEFMLKEFNNYLEKNSSDVVLYAVFGLKKIIKQREQQREYKNIERRIGFEFDKFIGD